MFGDAGENGGGGAPKDKSDTSGLLYGISDGFEWQVSFEPFGGILVTDDARRPSELPSLLALYAKPWKPWMVLSGWVAPGGSAPALLGWT